MAELAELPNDPAAGRVRRPGGGSNSATHDLFKRDLQDLVDDDLGIEIRVDPSIALKVEPAVSSASSE